MSRNQYNWHSEISSSVRVRLGKRGTLVLNFAMLRNLRHGALDFAWSVGTRPSTDMPSASSYSASGMSIVSRVNRALQVGHKTVTSQTPGGWAHSLKCIIYWLWDVTSEYSSHAWNICRTVAARFLTFCFEHKIDQWPAWIVRFCLRSFANAVNSLKSNSSSTTLARSTEAVQLQSVSNLDVDVKAEPALVIAQSKQPVELDAVTVQPIQKITEIGTDVHATHTARELPFNSSILASGKLNLKKPAPIEQTSPMKSKPHDDVLGSPTLYSALSAGLKGRRNRLSNHEFARMSDSHRAAAALPIQITISEAEPTSVDHKTHTEVLPANDQQSAALVESVIQPSPNRISAPEPAVSSAIESTPKPPALPFNAAALSAIKLKSKQTDASHVTTPSVIKTPLIQSSSSNQTPRPQIPFTGNMLSAVKLKSVDLQATTPIPSPAITTQTPQPPKSSLIPRLTSQQFVTPEVKEHSPNYRMALLKSASRAISDALANSPLVFSTPKQSSTPLVESAVKLKPIIQSTVKPSSAPLQEKQLLSPPVSVKDAAAKFGVLLSPSRPKQLKSVEIAPHVVQPATTEIEEPIEAIKLSSSEVDDEFAALEQRAQQITSRRRGGRKKSSGRQSLQENKENQFSVSME